MVRLVSHVRLLPKGISSLIITDDDAQDQTLLDLLGLLDRLQLRLVVTLSMI